MARCPGCSKPFYHLHKGRGRPKTYCTISCGKNAWERKFNSEHRETANSRKHAWKLKNIERVRADNMLYARRRRLELKSALVRFRVPDREVRETLP